MPETYIESWSWHLLGGWLQRGNTLQAKQPGRVRNRAGTTCPAAAQASTTATKQSGLFPWLEEASWGTERTAGSDLWPVILTQGILQVREQWVHQRAWRGAWDLGSLDGRALVPSWVGTSDPKASRP